MRKMLLARRFRHILKMALTVSLRRVLLLLLTATIFILMVLYWNQDGMKPQSFLVEKSMKRRADVNKRPPIPDEKLWTYKCENERCVRHTYPTNDGGGSASDRRIPFMTCAMTCGEVNIWPHPTIKTAISSVSLKFTMEDVQLRMDTPHSAVETQFKQAFAYFLSDLRRIQRLPSAEESTESVGGGVAGGADRAAATDVNSGGRSPLSEHHQNQQQQKQQQQHHNSRARRDTADAGHHNTHAHPGAAAAGVGDSESPGAYHHRHKRRHIDIGRALGNTLGDNMAPAAILSNVFNTRRHCDVDTLLVQVEVHKSGEINLSLDTDESYKLSVAHERRTVNIHITANSFFGARHALSTLQQLIWYDDEDNLLHILSKAIIIDTPRFRYRGLMLDTSRHYFSVEAIKRTIVGMSHAKLNRFHWHITDSQSFPYVSKHFPEMAIHGAYSEHETYTFEDVREVAAFARVHGIQVLPEIDAPAHAGNGWEWGPKRGLGELSLCINQQPWSFYCGEPPCGQLNPKNNNTYLVLQRLYEELLNATGPTDYFHLGGDEVNLECWGQYFNDTDLRGLWCDFMLNAMARLKIANNNVEPRVVSVWSSGLTNTKCLPSSRFAVQVWGGSTWQENYDLIDNGFNVIFSHVDAWYLDCGFGNWRSTGEGACSPYRTWQNVYKHRPWERMRLKKAQRKQVLGGEVCMWTEQTDEYQITTPTLDNRLWKRCCADGERLWSDLEDDREFDVVPQDVFKRMSVFRNRLVELGLEAEPIFPKFCAQHPGECI
ncbi:probable beta-hexosaminidase fdl [Bactrocera neohumeralis]|uniref:probable beta-hexosaminidase fdl n=1 Tax=Bactrocera neohumeralis TaxID=98809 RepID=UPI0021654B03|nr:probable beta-hexosaminidase fdl [Bactrocera neohumeralis]